MKMRLKMLLILLLAANCRLAVTGSFAEPVNSVRVAIMQDAQYLNLNVSGHYEITDSTGGKVLYRGKNLRTTVTSYKGGILIGQTSINADNIIIKAATAAAIILDGRRFTGDIEMIKDRQKKLLVINRIDLEDYIKGILYHESSHYWPMEALKAQAIVCRSYAVYQRQENKGKDFDVTSDIYSQVYGGKTSERYRTNKAVDQTKGIILNYRGKPIPGYYHATCGGHTQDASLLWNIEMAPLAGVVCSFCKESPHFNWHYVLSVDEITKKLKEAGYAVGDIKNITVSGRDKSGRVTDLKFACDKKEIKISAKDFRNTIGPNIIKSTNFNLNLIKGDAVFTGLGWGHGVGLCQWGAYFMAKQGHNYQDILAYYYPQSNVETIRF